jgi:hypothetical protein
LGVVPGFLLRAITVRTVGSRATSRRTAKAKGRRAKSIAFSLNQVVDSEESSSEDSACLSTAILKIPIKKNCLFFV